MLAGASWDEKHLGAPGAWRNPCPRLFTKEPGSGHLASKSQSWSIPPTKSQGHSAALTPAPEAWGALALTQILCRAIRGSKLRRHRPQVHQPYRRHPICAEDTNSSSGRGAILSAEFQSRNKQNTQFCYPPWAWCSSQQQ